jgi:zinc protease
MQIPPLSLLQTGFYFLNDSACILKESWKRTFEPFFAIYKTAEKKLAELRILPSAPAATLETAAKVEEIAAKQLADPPAESATIDLTQKLRLDPHVTVRKLDNGFTYYIRKNGFPDQKTASLRLVVRAGSVDEQESERGVAHLVEHLVINYETENFSKHQVKNYFTSIGAVNGADQNAYTSFDETVYELNIPLHTPEVLEKALQIMSEWAYKSKISDASVEEERPIVLDEIINNSAQSRYAQEKQAILLEGTPYPERFPRGIVKVIKECSPEQVRAFYRRWYQPNNMALIAVGDFDPKYVEALIRQHFSSIPPSSHPPAIHKFIPNVHKETRFFLYQDPETTVAQCELYFPVPTPLMAQLANKELTWQGIRQGVIGALCREMLAARLREPTAVNASRFIATAKVSIEEQQQNLLYFKVFALVNNDILEMTLKQILIEIKRIRSQGFLQEELEELKGFYLASLKREEQDLEYCHTESLASLYADHFSGETSPPVDPRNVFEVKKKLLDTVSLADVNQVFCSLTSPEGLMVSASMSKSPQIVPLTKEMMEQIFNEVLQQEIEPYAQNTPDWFLLRLRSPPTPGKILETRLHEKAGVTEWILESGMRVFFKPSRVKQNQILSMMTANRGKLSCDLEDRASVKMAEFVLSIAWMSPWVIKFLKKSAIQHRPSLGNYLSGFRSQAPKGEMESLFQILRISIVGLVCNEEQFTVTKKELVDIFKTRLHDPEIVLKEAIRTLSTQHHPAFLPLESEDIEKADYVKAIDFLWKRLSNPANFHLTLVGDMEENEVRQLVERYLAGIPKNGEREEAFSLPGYEYPSGIVTKELHGGVESSSKCHISFPAPVADERRERAFGVWTGVLLKHRLFEKFRYEQGKTYNMSCSFYMTSLPGLNKTDPCSMELFFTSLPENMDSLREKILEEIACIQSKGFTEEEFATFKVARKEIGRKSSEDDDDWVDLIDESAEWGWEIDSIFDDSSRLLEGFTPQIAQEMVKKLFPLNRYTQVTLHPKTESSAR